MVITLLMAVPAVAEFTDQEKAEGVKLVRAYEDLGWALENTGDLELQVGSEAFATQIGSLSLTIVEAMHNVADSLGWLLDVNAAETHNSGETILSQGRARVLQECFINLDVNIDFLIDSALTKAAALSDNFDVSEIEARLIAARGRLESFDRTLPYLQPRIFPDDLAADGDTIIAGPHGQYNDLGERYHRADQYTLRRTWVEGIIPSYQLEPLAFAGDYENATKFAQRYTFALIRSFGMLGDITLPEDQATIDLMFNQGTTPRGPEFFRLALMEQLILNGDGNVNGFGLTEEVGMTHWYEAALNRWSAAVMRMTNPDNFFLVGDGMAHSYDGWRHFDAAMWDSLMFALVPGPSPSNCNPDPGPCEECPVCPSSEIIVDDMDPNTEFFGNWVLSSGALPWSGQSTAEFDGAHLGEVAWFKWLPNISESGTYEVWAWWTKHPNRITNAPYVIHHAGAEPTVVVVNQRANEGQWNLLGTFVFTGDGSGFVEIRGDNGQVSADAIRFVEK